MKTSVRRHSLRLIRGVNKKFESTRWIGQWTVRVQASANHLRADHAYVKAGKGVEKSLRASRRRKRGLRRGARRSRGGKPRTIRGPSALESKEPGTRVLLHAERLFGIMRRSQMSLMARVEQSVTSGGFVRDFSDASLRRHISALWSSHSRHFPPSHRATFFGRSADEFISRLVALVEEDQSPPVKEEAPPLPRRPGAPAIPYRVRPPRSPPRPVERIGSSLALREALVPNSTLETHRKKDSYGPNPCPWCRADWASIGEVGACLEIQDCVRSPESIRRREEELKGPRRKGPSRSGASRK